jgi:hypothetical protein
MRILLWRILGNDMVPRHSATHVEDNLKYILDNEEPFAGCEKRFFLNRILDKRKEEKYHELITKQGYKVSLLQFDPEVYKNLHNDMLKRHYLIPVNTARNICIRQGFKEEFEYVLPLDGSAFFRGDGWDEFVRIASANSDTGYYALGQWRPNSYDELHSGIPILREEYAFPARGGGEQRIISQREFAFAFTEKADYLFDEKLLFGHADKIELHYRLGIPGIWDRWEPQLRKRAQSSPSKWMGKVVCTGWIAHLPSGNSEADNNNLTRGRLREVGFQNLVKYADSLLDRVTVL